MGILKLEDVSYRYNDAPKDSYVFKNINYDKEKSYYLVIVDEETGIEKQRIRFIIDIAIINNFGF